MGYLYFDIETYVSKNDTHSGLNPYLPESKVIVISYTYYNTFHPPSNDKIVNPTFLKEWESNEQTILTIFYNKLKEIHQNDKYLTVCGFNILNFDLPYLFGRMMIHKIASESELFSVLYSAYAIDMYQLSGIISHRTRKFEKIMGMNQKEVSEFFSLTVKEGTGDECSKFYDDKEFEKILAYCRQEFNFEQMLSAFYCQIINSIKL